MHQLDAKIMSYVNEGKSLVTKNEVRGTYGQYLKTQNLINWVFKTLKDRPLDDAKSSQACNIYTLRPDAEGEK